MLAGFCEKEYTPAEGNMPGEIGPYYAKGAETPLMAHAATLTSGGQTVIIVSMDIIFITTDLAARIKKDISAKTGVPVPQIILAATHIHTGCGTDYQCWGTPAEPDVANHAGDVAVEAAVEAFENQIEVKWGIGLGYEERFSFCRDWYLTTQRLRSNPGYKGEELAIPLDSPDQSVNVMRLEDGDGRPRCFIVNYANHPDTDNTNRTKFSADYPGHLRVALRRRYGRDVVVVFLNGCCGDVNHLDFKNRTDAHYRRKEVYTPQLIGEGLAESVQRINDRILMRDEEMQLGGWSEMHMTKRRRTSDEERAWAARMLEKKEAGEEVSAHTLLLCEQYLADESHLPEEVPVEIHTVQIGPWAVVGLPGEIYSCIGKRIKANSPFADTLVVELESGANGYISPDIIQDCGAYEGIYSSIAFTGHGTVDVLVNGATEMLNRMHKEYLDKAFGNIVLRPVTTREK